MLEIEQILTRILGLNVASIGHAVVHRAVHDRMAKCGLNHVEQYRARLARDSDELQALIEELVVPETWFFRNAEAVAKLVELFTTDWSVVQRGDVRRVLSVPCATGEEPYSIAIALAEAGLTHGEVQIDAMDISHRALARAKQGVYGANSFRGEASRICARYTYQVPGGMALLPEIRRWVRFAHGNLVAPAFHPPSSCYDVIFCRNVLIYLERTAQEHVMGVLHQLIAPGGYLFVGPAEAALAAECGFRVTEDTMAFMCQKVQRGIPLPHVAPRLPEHPAVQSMLKQVVTQVVKPAVKPAVVPLAPHPRHAPTRRIESKLSDLRQEHETSHGAKGESGAALSAPTEGGLERARKLADAGRLTEAADLCTAYLRDHGVAAEAYYLLGLVQDARGNAPRAVAYYRKALFLDPNHANASAQLAMHAQRAGDPAGAERLRARAQRIERRRTL